MTGRLQLAQPLLLPLLLAAQRDGDVDEVHARLAHQTHRQGADDALIVRVRGKEQRLGRVGGYLRPRRGGKGAEGKRAALLEQARIIRYELMIRSHIHLFTVEGLEECNNKKSAPGTAPGPMIR